MHGTKNSEKTCQLVAQCHIAINVGVGVQLCNGLDEEL
jgi:hypothetical protein